MHGTYDYFLTYLINSNFMTAFYFGKTDCFCRVSFSCYGYSSYYFFHVLSRLLFGKIFPNWLVTDILLNLFNQVPLSKNGMKIGTHLNLMVLISNPIQSFKNLDPEFHFRSKIPMFNFP